MTIYKGNTPLKVYKGDYKPVNIYKGETKVAGWENETQQAEQLAFSDTYKDYVTGLEILGKSTQSGTPTPSAPIAINSSQNFNLLITGGQTINYPITLRGIPNGSGGWVAQDKVDNDNSKVIRNIATYTITGTETPIVSTSGIYTRILTPISAKANNGSDTVLSTLCNKLKPFGRIGYDTPTEEGLCVNYAGNYLAIVLLTSRCGSTVDSVKAYFVANNMLVQYAKATPTEEPITKQTITTTQLLTEFSTDVVIKPDVKVTVKVMTL